MSKRLPEEIKNKIKTLYEQGFGSTTIARKMDISEGCVAGYIYRCKDIQTRSNREKSLKYTCNENYFNQIDTEEKAYWLGFIYADGYVTRTEYSGKIGIALTIGDKKHLEKFKKAICATHPIKVYYPKANSSNYSTKGYCRINIISDILFKKLVELGVFEHKTNVLQPPLIDFPENLKRHFIRGFFDGNGCIAVSHRKNKKHPSYAIKIVSTEPFLDYIKEYIETNNISKINMYHKRKPTQIVSSLEMGGNVQARKFLDLIYKDSTVYLDRKYQRYMDLCKMLDSRVTAKAVA